MTRRARDSGEEEVVITGHAGAAAADRPAKRRRTTATRDAYDESLTLPGLIKRASPRLLRALLAHVLPADLVALCTAFDTVKDVLQKDAANDIWIRSRVNMPGPRAPRCPASMSESEWTSLLFVKKCQHCGKPTTREVDWGLRMRFCSACHTEHVKSNRVVVALPGVTVDILKLVPYSKIAGGGTTVEYYWVPEVLSVHGQLKRLNQKLDAGDAAAKRSREAFIRKRKEYVEEVLDFVAEGERWQKLFKDACAGGAQSELRKRIVAKFVEMGYRAEDVEAELPATISDAVLSGTGLAWTRLLNKVQPRLDQVRGALSIKVALLHEHYRNFLGGYIPRGWEAQVPFGDISRMRDVQARLDGASDAQVVALAKDVTTIVDTWRREVEQQLLRLLPNRPDDAAWLRLALAVFVRGADPAPLTYPHMLLGAHLRAMEFGPLPYATAQGPWTADGLRYDALGATVAREYCRFSGIEITRATIAQLDESPIRLQCTLCRDEWPLVLSWRQAVEHTHRLHAQCDVTQMWRLSSVATERQMRRLDEDAELWQCVLCPAASQVLRSLKDVKRHLEKRHNVEDYARGKEFRRSLTAPAQDPITVLDVHTKSEDRGSVEKRYECRHCGHVSALTVMLVHLKNRHLIELKPNNAQAMQPLPPHRSPAPPSRSSDASIGNPQPREVPEARRPPRKAVARNPPLPPSNWEPRAPAKRRRSYSSSSSSDSDPHARQPAVRGDGKPTASSSRPAPNREVIMVDDSSSASSSDCDATARSEEQLHAQKPHRAPAEPTRAAASSSARPAPGSIRPAPAAIRPAPAPMRPAPAPMRPAPAPIRPAPAVGRPTPTAPRPTAAPTDTRPIPAATRPLPVPIATRPGADSAGPPEKRRAISISSSSSSDDETAAVVAAFEQVTRRQRAETIDLTLSDAPMPETGPAADGPTRSATRNLGGLLSRSPALGAAVSESTCMPDRTSSASVDAVPAALPPPSVSTRPPALHVPEQPKRTRRPLSPGPVSPTSPAGVGPIVARHRDGDTKPEPCADGSLSLEGAAAGVTVASEPPRRGASREPTDTKPVVEARQANPEPATSTVDQAPPPPPPPSNSQSPSSAGGNIDSDAGAVAVMTNRKAPAQAQLHLQLNAQPGPPRAPAPSRTASNAEEAQAAREGGMRYACLRCATPSRTFSGKEMLAHLRSAHDVDDASREVHYTFAPRPRPR